MLESMQLLRTLARQRVQLPALIQHIRSQINTLTDTDHATFFRLLGELRQVHSDDLTELPKLTDVPSSLNLAVGVLLYNTTTQRDMVSDTLLNRSISIVADSVSLKENMPQSWNNNPELGRDLRTVRFALQYCYPDIYQNLGESCLELLARSALSESPSWNPNRMHPPNHRFISQVGEILFKENIDFIKYAQVGPYIVDILERDRKIVWECNSESRYYSTSRRETTAHYDLKRMVLRGMGYQVVPIPYWHWYRLANRRLRSDYCRASRFLALRDVRENNTSSSRPRDPTAFRADELSTVYMNFQGGGLFNKEVPKQNWSWHSSIGVPTRISV